MKLLLDRLKTRRAKHPWKSYYTMIYLLLDPLDALSHLFQGNKISFGQDVRYIGRKLCFCLRTSVAAFADGLSGDGLCHLFNCETPLWRYRQVVVYRGRSTRLVLHIWIRMWIGFFMWKSFFSFGSEADRCRVRGCASGAHRLGSASVSSKTETEISVSHTSGDIYINSHIMQCMRGI